ncbi:MAG: biliverdin-producing heme oxygenase [Geminicoccaceae bacterium]
MVTATKGAVGQLACERRGDRPLSSQLAESTRELHRVAERTGFIAELLRGRASRKAYLHYLSCLQPVYEALERGLERTDFVDLAARELRRSTAIAADLEVLGASWRPVVLPAARAYATRISWLSRTHPARLAAHSYVRYMGDLSGGRVMRGLLEKTLLLQRSELAFHEFPEIPDPATFKNNYRGLLDRVGRSAERPSTILDEAQLAFRYNIELSVAISDAVR